MAKNNVPDRITLRNYEITFKNFSGRKNDYNRNGDRNFALVLDDETADQLLSDGWNVRIKEYDDGSRRNTLQVAVRYDIERFRPKVVMVTPHGKYFKRTLLNEDTVNVLDPARVAKAYVTLNPSPWKNAMGNTGIKAYLTTGYFVVEKDEFEDEFPEEPSDSDDYVDEALPFE